LKDKAVGIDGMILKHIF